MKSTTNIILNLQVPNYSVAAYAVQGDEKSREINATLLDGSTPWTPPAGALGTVRYLKPDGTAGFYDTLEDGETVAVTWVANVATIRLAAQVLTVEGEVIVQLSFYSADAERLSCFNFRLFVEKNPLTDDEFESTDYYSVLTARIAAVLGAVAHAPQINSAGHWVLWDEESQEYYDSGVNATGPRGDIGPRGYAIGSTYLKSGTGAAGTTSVYGMKLDDPDETEVGTFDVYNGQDGQGAPGSQTPLQDGIGSAGSANAYSREDHRHPLNVPASGAPEMDGEASQGFAATKSLSDQVHPTDTSRQIANKYFSNVSVAQSDFAADSTYTDFGYKATIALTGVTSTMFADVVYAPAQAMSGLYAPVCATYNGGVYIYAKEDTAITIPLIKIEGGPPS